MNPIVSARSRAGSRRPPLRVLTAGRRHVAPADGPGTSDGRRPALRIVPDARQALPPRLGPVLLAGADARHRAALRAEFGATLPPRTRWVEADDVAQALERASFSRMAILAGDLDDTDAESLMRLLGRRHPELPVICVDAPMPAAAGGRG